MRNFSRLMKASLVTVISFCCHSALAQVDSNIQAPDVPVPGSLIMGKMPSPDSWQFLMGPVGAPDMVAKLIWSQPEGGIAFMCHKDTGKMEMAITTAKDPQFTLMDIKDFSFKVGEESHLLKMQLKSISSTRYIWYVSFEDAIPQILSTMASIPVWREENISLSYEKTTNQFPPIYPRDIASKMSTICQGWWSDAHNIKPIGNETRVKTDSGETLVLPSAPPPVSGLK